MQSTLIAMRTQQLNLSKRYIVIVACTFELNAKMGLSILQLVYSENTNLFRSSNMHWGCDFSVFLGSIFRE